jgi:hypothetical protein
MSSPDDSASRDETGFTARMGIGGPEPWAAALAYVLFAIAAVGAGMAVTLAAPPLAIPAVVIAYLAFGMLRQSKSYPPASEHETVEATRHHVVVRGRTHLQSSFAAGFVVPDEGRFVVHLEPKSGFAMPLRLVAENAHDAQTLLRTLGLDAASSVAPFRTGARLLASPWLWNATIAGSVVAWMVVCSVGSFLPGSFLPALLVSSALAIAVATMWPSRVEVGADGVNVRWLLWRRFVPASTILRAAPYVIRVGQKRFDGVALTLRGGAEYRIPVTTGRDEDERTGLLLHRIREILPHGGHVAETASAITALARHEAETDAKVWLARLRAIGRGENATHRTAPVAPDTLWAIVENAKAAPRLRVAAAAALGRTNSPPERMRLTSAAVATADPRVRIALDAVATGNDLELERALGELPAEDDAQARSLR